MSVDREINVGWYIKGTLSTYTKDISVIACTNNVDHLINKKDQFCSKCGGKVDKVTVTKSYNKYFLRARYSEAEWCDESLIEPIDKAFEYWKPILMMYNLPEDHVFFKPSVITIDEDGLYFELPINPEEHKPTDEQIQLILDVMKYPSYSLHYGVLQTYS